MLHFYTAAGQSTTDFQVDKEASVVTAIGIDDTGNIWTGHLKVSVWGGWGGVGGNVGLSKVYNRFVGDAGSGEGGAVQHNPLYTSCLLVALQGLVRMRQRLMWENHCEDKAFSSAVRIIVFDDEKRAWIGDDAGRVKVRDEGASLKDLGSPCPCARALHSKCVQLYIAPRVQGS
jgi:hypothetical protein